MEYVVFTDESYISGSRFQSISAFSLHRSVWKNVQDCMSEILLSSNISEFKWTKLKNEKYYSCAEKMVNYLFDNIHKHKMRIDVIVWDMYDSRHKIQNRDDIANYERMFFHLLSNSMKKRPRNAKWDIRPDQRSGIDWNTISDCLSAKGRQWSSQYSLFFSDQYFVIESFREQCSKSEPLIQIADLFTGLAVFSKETYKNYRKWKQQSIPSLFDQETVTFTNRQRYRFKLLDFFNNKCKNENLGVSLESKKCLFTYDARKPINFWHYEPQHKNDKAPLKKEKENNTYRL